jgi:hypothetical protein
MGAAEELLAIEEIKQLKARYLQGVDGKDWELFASTFTADAEMDFHGEVEFQIRDDAQRAALPADAFKFHGPAEAVAALAGHLAGCVTVHYAMNPQIELTGADQARGIWRVWDTLDYGHEVFEGHGVYHERYVRDGDAWRTSAIKLTRLRTAWRPLERRWSGWSPAPGDFSHI